MQPPRSNTTTNSNATLFTSCAPLENPRALAHPSRVSLILVLSLVSSLQASPAATQSVFFDTDPATLAPRDCSLAFASFRFIWLSVPVRTYILPANTSAAADTSMAGQCKPNLRIFSITSWLLFCAKKRAIFFATMGPTSGTRCKLNSSAAKSASEFAKMHR